MIEVPKQYDINAIFNQSPVNGRYLKFKKKDKAQNTTYDT